MARKKKENNEKVTENNNILLESRVEASKIKEDLEKYVDEKINQVFIDELDKANRKLLREKSKKLFFKNIIIVILLLIIAFLVYLLYSNSYFDNFFNKTKNQIQEVDLKSDNNKEKEEKKEKDDSSEKEKSSQTLTELKHEYAPLLDNYIISEKSIYLKDYYEGNLTDKLKNYLALSIVDFNTLSKEDDYQIIANDTLKKAYEKIFSDQYHNINFDYNDNSIRYVNKLESFITTTVLNNETNIKREIKDIKLVDGIIVIDTIEGMQKDNKLFNILTGDEVENYHDDSLLNYEEFLNKVTYSFKEGKLIKLEK